MNIRSLFPLSALLFFLPSLGAIDIQTAYPVPSGHTPIAVASANETDVMVASRGSIAVRKKAREWSFIYTGNPNDTFSDLTFARLPSPDNRDPRFDGGLFIAVGMTKEGGVTQAIALTSRDGETWDRSPIPDALGVTSVAFGKGTFVVSGQIEGARRGGSLGQINPATFTSDDGKTWKTHDISDPDRSGSLRNRVDSRLEVVRFLAGNFIGASSLNDLYLSEDGVTWERRESGPQAADIGDIAGKEKLLVAVGRGGVRISKNGGKNWDKVDNSHRWSDVVYYEQKDLFVAVGPKEKETGPKVAGPTPTGPAPKESDGIAISKNGVDWTFVTEKPFLQDAAILTAICDSKNGLIAVGPSASSDGIATVMTSNDGQAWVSNYFSRFIWDGLFSSDGTYYAAGGAADPVSPTEPSQYTYRGAILKSPDGLNWAPILETPTYLRAIAKGGGNFVAVGGTTDDRESAKILHSEDGHDWRNGKVDRDPGILNDVVFGNGLFVAVGSSDNANRPVSAIFYSDNRGTSWSYSKDSRTGRELRAVAYGSPQGTPTFVAVGEAVSSKHGNELILRSIDDGKTWSDVTPEFPSNSKVEKSGLHDVTFVNGAFIAVGDGIFCTSADGQTWKKLSSLKNDRHLTNVEAGQEDLYIAKDILNNKTNDSDSVLSVHDLIGFRQSGDSLDFEQIYSLTAMGKKLVIGTDDGISRTIFQPVINISPAPKLHGRDVDEDDGEADAFFVITRDERPEIGPRINLDPNDKLTVHYTFAGSATPEKDYKSPRSGTVEFMGSGTEARIRVDVKDDPEVERPENIVCTISASEDYVVGDQKRAAITIRSEDVPTANFAVTSAQVTEGKDLEIVLRRNSDIGKTTLNVTADSSSTASPNDYTLDTSVVFREGETTQRLTLRALTDNLAEGTESLVLQLTSVNGDGKVGIKSTMTISLVNVAPTGGNSVTVTATVGGTGEGSPEVGNFRIERTGGTDAISVNIAISGTASNGTDYTLISSPVLIPANVNSADVGVTPIPDTDVEGDETVILTIQPGTGYNVGTPVNATVNLLDDDD